MLREMTAADVPQVVAVQKPGAIAALPDVFPQESYPFPADVVARRWYEEVADPEIDCLVIQRDGVVIGFAATRGDELLHFGIDLALWGTGLGRAAHDAVLDRMRRRHVSRAWLRVFVGNRRARAFYEKLGWRSTGERSRSPFPPHPELLRYEVDLGDPPAA
jgi:RimJ/RimL family protein N-acetyltransferase